MAISQNFPDIKPSFVADFANTKALDSRITFARASTGAYYDGVAHAKAEENLLLRSQEFNDAAWGKNDITLTADTETAPDGTTTAETLNEGTETDFHILSQSAGITANTQYVFSCFGKNVDGQYLVLSIRGNGANIAAAEFDLSTGVLSKTYQIGTGFSVDATSIVETPVGSGWYRCVVEATVGANVSGQTNYIAMSDGSAFVSTGIPTYTGTNRTIHIWGAQLEQRSAVTSYTATTTQPITNYIPVLQTAPANTARFDHDPVTGESLGLLVEEQRTNLVTYSEDFANASWFKPRASIFSDTIIAPDGTLTGDRLFEDTTASNSHYVRQQVSVTSGTTYTWSVYLRNDQKRYAQVTLGDPTVAFGSVFANVDLFLGTIIVTGANTLASSISPVGNGWYRISVTGAAIATVANGHAYVFLANSAFNTSYTGDGYSGIYIWGAQLEAGAFPTSYIPTVASQVTRAADTASMTGANFSDWFSNKEGTFYLESSSAVTDGGFAFGFFLNTAAGGATNSIYTDVASNQRRLVVFYNGVVQTDILGGAISSNTMSKMAITFNNNSFTNVVNGGTVQTDSSGLVPLNLNQIIIGTNPGNTASINGRIKKLAFYPKQIVASNSQAITS